MKRVLACSCAIALMAAPVVALAAENTGTTQESTGMSGAAHGMMTETQIKQKLEKEGYSNIKLQRATSTEGSGSSTAGTSASKPEYTGTATKNGETVHFQVDNQGQVTKE